MKRGAEPHGDDAGSGLGAARVEVADADSVLAYLAAVVELLDWVPPTTLPRREVIGGFRRKRPAGAQLSIDLSAPIQF